VVPVLWVILPALLAGLMLGCFWAYGWYNSRSSTNTAALGGLAWGHTRLYNTHEMRAWLGDHGASYRVWKRRHPAAYRIITHKTHTKQK
jgi:hypothetical protein